MTEVNIRTSAAAAGVLVGAAWFLAAGSSSATVPTNCGPIQSGTIPLSVSSASLPPDESIRVEVRSSPASLMADGEVNAAVYAACRALRSRLGSGYGFVVEEMTDPAEPEAEPRLFLFVSMHPTDSVAAEAVDQFILGEWGQQSERIRGIVRVGSEFV